MTESRGEQLTLPPLVFPKRVKMATSSERSPPPFPDSEDQDVLDAEEVRGRDSDEDEDLFGSTVCTSGVDLAVSGQVWITR